MHVSGGQTVTQTLAAGASLSSQPYLSSDTDGQAPEGVRRPANLEDAFVALTGEEIE